MSKENVIKLFRGLSRHIENKAKKEEELGLINEANEHKFLASIVIQKVQDLEQEDKDE